MSSLVDQNSDETHLSQAIYYDGVVIQHRYILCLTCMSVW